MISWVREKLTEGRLRWQKSAQQRNNTSPPPLPPPDAIDESQQCSPVENTSRSIESVVALTAIQPASPPIPRPTNLALQLRDTTLDSIKSNTNSIKRLSHSSRIDDGIDREFSSSQYDKSWPTSNTSFSNQQTSTSIVVNRRAKDSSVPYVNLRIFNKTGSKCTICAPVTLTVADIKRKVVAEFHARRQLSVPGATASDSMPGSSQGRRIDEPKMNCDNLDLVQLSRHYKLTRINKLHEHFDEASSLATANVQNNEEWLLVACSKSVTNDSSALTFKQTTEMTQNHDDESDSDDNDACKNLTQLDIDAATAHLQPKNIRGPNMVNIDELVLQSDVQYDIRKILISLANACAYVVGSGPYAQRIICMLKQRLVQRKRHEQDTQQCLIDMGFPLPKVQHALNICSNVYATALEWLIENQSPTNPLFSEDQSAAMSISSKFANNASVKDNVESLLEIIRIHCQRDLPPPTEMIQFIVAMGFDEATAHEALKVTKNHQSNACEWLVGDRSKINQFEQNDGLPSDSPILTALLNSPHIQLSLSNPKIFIAYLSILEDYGSMGMWMNDNETSSVIGQVLRTYHEEKHIMAINQFSKK